MDQNQFKLAVEVHEGRGFNGVTNTTVLVSYGDRKFKVKSKLKTKTTHPIWHDLFELYETTRNGLQLTFFSAVDSKHPQPLLISVVEKDKKLNPWTTKIDTQRLSKLNHTWRESWEPLKDNGSGPSKPHIKIRLKVCGGSPLKKPAKVAAPAAPRKQTDGKGNQKKASGFSLSPLVQLIKDDDSLGLEDYLLTITPEEINRQHPKNGNTALHEACIEKREAALPLLLQREGITVDLPNANKNTPLHYFCEHWTSPDYLHCFTLFIKNGANVNAVNSNGETPLFKAIFNPSIRTLLMEALIEHNADVNAVSSTGEGVLHYAVRLGRSDLVDMILQARPKLNMKGGDGYTPYELATKVYKTEEHQKIGEHLLQVGELFDWLEANQLSDFKGLFIRNEILLSLVPEITDSLLKDQMGVESAQGRQAILKACNAYRDKLGVAPDASSPGNLTKKDKGKAPTMSAKAVLEGFNEIRASSSCLPEKDALILEKALTELTPNNSRDWIIENKQLEYLKHLGTGVSGDVYKGLYKNKAGITVECAIKVLKEMSATQEIDEFKKEFEVLSAVSHPNVIQFYGASLQQRLCMVMEYCANETLFHVMKNPLNTFGWDFGIQACYETVLGLQALHTHQPAIFHRDVKSLNLLVSADWHIKIIDFGLSRFNTPANQATFTQMRGTFAYCDPAIYLGQKFTTASDIFSVGIIFWEITNCILKQQYSQPYSEYKNLTFDFQIIIQAAQENLRPTIDPSCPKSFVELISTCLKTKQAERPSLESILSSLQTIKKQYNASKAEWDCLKPTKQPSGGDPSKS